MRTPQSAVPPQLRSHILHMGQVAQAIVARCGSIIASKDVVAALALDQDDDAMDEEDQADEATLVSRTG